MWIGRLGVSLWFSFLGAIPVLAEVNASSHPDTEHRLLAQQDKNQRPKGWIDFETFPSITTGMTKDEVLRLAGSPAEDNACAIGSHCLNRWVYYYGDRWLVEVLFDRSWRVVAVNNFRSN